MLEQLNSKADAERKKEGKTEREKEILKEKNR